MNALLGEQGFVADGRFVINQPVVGHGFAVGIGKDGFAENFAGVFGRGGGERNFNGIEIIQYAAVGG